jgi:hypothetical protein
LNFEEVLTSIAIEKDQGAVIVVRMDGIEPGVRVIVEALAGATPKFFVSGANVKQALLNDVDEPKNVWEGSSDLLKRFAGRD